MSNGLWMISTIVVAFVVTAVSGIWLLPVLRKLKFGQTILDIGPSWHKNKQGTPTMGGIMFVLGIVLAVVVGFTVYRIGMPSHLSGNTVVTGSPIMKARLFYGIMLALGYGLIGFADDYIKVVRKQNEGLTEKQKLLLQLLCGTAYLLLMYMAGDRMTTLIVPFFGSLDIGLLYYPFALFAMLALSNAVNLTDGIDGLLCSVTFIGGLAYMLIASVLGMWEMNILACAMVGGCLGFLVWNFHPAKVFMGDTGSLFLGGIIIALAFGTGLPLFILLIGVIYLIEMLSVVIQRFYFKATHGKRIFKMSPIHHHFELSGWSEMKIVAIFSLITLVGAALAVWAVMLL
ncbi:MAG: phospho-N-acetylmuramoyl-pentapeptide-transferase [Angelakisella sp.]